MPMSISLEESNGYVNKMRRIIAGFPEVQTAISQSQPAMSSTITKGSVVGVACANGAKEGQPGLLELIEIAEARRAGDARPDRGGDVP